MTAASAELTGWARYAQAVAVELDLLGRPPIGLSGTVRSDLPTGAGLSSSAALEVSVALALCAIAGFELEPFALALACQRAELRAVGVPCGILDQAASVLGREGEAILLDCGTLDYRLVPVPAQAALVVVDSAVSHSHESSGYADRRRELEHALQLVGATRSTEVELAALDSLDPLSQRRLRHVVTENRRVLEFVAALERGDLAAAGALLLAGHASLRDDYEVSIPEIDLLVELACDAGAYGARLLGGGFGGSIIALADVERAEEIAAAVSDELPGADRARRLVARGAGVSGRQRVREPVGALEQAVPLGRVGAAARGAEPALGVIQVEVDLGPRLEIARVARRVQVGGGEVARREADRRLPFDPQAEAVVAGQRQPARVAVQAVLLREDVRHVLLGDGALEAADDRRGEPVGVVLPGPAAVPRDALEAGQEDEPDPDARHVVDARARARRRSRRPARPTRAAGTCGDA